MSSSTHWPDQDLFELTGELEDDFLLVEEWEADATTQKLLPIVPVKKTCHCSKPDVKEVWILNKYIQVCGTCKQEVQEYITLEPEDDLPF